MQSTHKVEYNADPSKGRIHSQTRALSRFPHCTRRGAISYAGATASPPLLWLNIDQPEVRLDLVCACAGQRGEFPLFARFTYFRFRSVRIRQSL